ncbi:MAG: DMT family transporter [bacterium]|nr:DMT family transporter [bacterium]
MWLFLIISTLAWGIAEIFYKKGCAQNEKYSHLKVTIFVGFFMGIYALVELFAGGVDLKSFPLNFIYYSPVAACYIVSMICSYFGVRFIEESIADPIENSGSAIVPILCAVFLHEKFGYLSIIAISIIFIGLIGISVFDKKGKENREKRLGKRIAIWAIAMPFCYMLLDATGTFLDIFYTEDVTRTLLINVSEANIEHTANCAYEFTFFIVAIILYIFIRAKGERLFIKSENDGVFAIISTQKWKILAGIFETIGQATYLFALSSGSGIAAVILGAGTVIVSLLLSRFFLKEKISVFQLIFVLIILSGIIMLSLL